MIILQKKKIIMSTNFISYISPNVMWGTQEMLWPLNPNIQKASERVEQLATPKKDFSTVDSKGRYVMILITNLIFYILHICILTCF